MSARRSTISRLPHALAAVDHWRERLRGRTPAVDMLLPDGGRERSATSSSMRSVRPGASFAIADDGVVVVGEDERPTAARLRSDHPDQTGELLDLSPRSVSDAPR